MEDNNSQEEKKGYKGPDGVDGFHALLNIWLVLISVGNLGRIFSNSALCSVGVPGGVTAYNIVLNIVGIVCALGLLMTHKMRFFFFLIGTAIVNACIQSAIDPGTAIVQVFTIIVFLLFCRLKKNGKSAYKVMGF